MPQLSAFGLRFSLSQDDLPVPSALGSVFCAVWVALVAAGIATQWQQCDDGINQRLQQLTLGCLLAVNLVCHLLLAYCSNRGAPLQTDRRTLVAPLLHAILVVYAALLGTNIWGTLILDSASPACSARIDRAIVYGVWAGLGAALLAVLLLLSLFGRDSLNSWASQVACCMACGCTYGKHARAERASGVLASTAMLSPQQQLAWTLHSVFGLGDLTWSDYLLGLVLVGVKQRLQRSRQWKADPGDAHPEAGQQGTDGTPSAPACSVETLQSALRYQAHAIAVYGWAMHIWANRWQAHRCCSICCGRGCGCITGLDGVYGPASMLGLNIGRRMTREAILGWTSMRKEDLLLVSDEDECESLLPYYVSADHKNKELVMCIRGTWSVEDVVTDLMWEPVTLERAGMSCEGAAAAPAILELSAAKLPEARQASACSSSYYCHGGMHTSARAIADHASPFLSDLISGAASTSAGATCQDYRLVVTGHSLGAGVAAIVGFMLRPRFPDLKVWAFSPPGGLLSPEASKAAGAFCTSIVTRKDMISRVSLANVHRLRDEAVELLALCKLNKAEVLLRTLLGKQWRYDELFHDSWQAVPDGVASALRDYQRQMQAYITETAGPAFDKANSLLVPGQMVYIKAHKPGGGGQEHYSAHCVSPQSINAPGLLVSRNMFMDHVPDRQRIILKKALEAAHGVPKAPPAWPSLAVLPLPVRQASTTDSTPTLSPQTGSPQAVAWVQNPLSA